MKDHSCYVNSYSLVIQQVRICKICTEFKNTIEQIFFPTHFSPNISILIFRLALICRQTKFLWSLTYQARPLLVFAFKKAGLSDFCKFSPVLFYKSSLPVTTTSKNHPSTLGKKQHVLNFLMIF